MDDKKQYDAGEYWASVLTSANFAQFHLKVGTLLDDQVHNRASPEDTLYQIAELFVRVRDSNRELWTLADCRP